MKIENPAFDYDSHGEKYSTIRKTDPRIAEHIHNALGDAKTVLNIGAGSGSYEPTDKFVISVEPSATMRLQRMRNGKIPAVIAKADSLPFDDNSFDAAMALLTIHHWPDIKAGLAEVRRVVKNRIVVMVFDPDALDRLWNVHYFPELIEVERLRDPKIDFVMEALGGNCRVAEVPIPFDCIDGFQEAYYGRPEEFLKEEVRKSQSAWGFLSKELEGEMVKRLADELESGEWDKKYGEHRTMPFFNGALRLVIAEY